MISPSRLTPVVVAIPVKDEEGHIAACLRAVARQEEIQANRIVLLLNDCADSTCRVIREVAPALSAPVEVIEHIFAADTGSAGYARHLAMEHVARGLTDGVLLTTDADGRVAPDWIAANVAAIQAGADAVAGRAIIDPADALLIPQQLHADDALECRYGEILDEIASLLDPDPSDPWPRHTEHSGASIAATVDAYRRAGGMPLVAMGEDREFFRRLQLIDARIRHAPDVTVTVSGRIVGRAEGGMADTIRRRLVKPDEWLDDRLEPPDDFMRRVSLRDALRQIWASGHEAQLGAIADELRVRKSWLADAMMSAFFGELWDRVEAYCPSLVRKRVPAAAVGEVTARARQLRDQIVRRQSCGIKISEHRGGTANVAAV
jgi:GT2 family glycosyltransferase